MDKEQKVNKVKPAKQSDLTLYQIIGEYFCEYCSNSSLHGIRYLGEKGRTKTERVLWFLFLIASIFVCSHLIQKTWTKWDSMPVVIAFAERPTYVWQVPFPAVTICSNTKIRKTKYNNYDDYHADYFFGSENNYTTEEKKQFLDITLVCDIAYYINETHNITNPSALDLIHDVAPQVDEFLDFCWWTTEMNKCHKYFSKSITKEGLCYTFNTLDGTELLNTEAQNERFLNYNVTSEWSLDKGYKVGSNMNVYPKRVLNSRVDAGLIILLKSYMEDLYTICKDPKQGFTIFFHSPDEIPQIDQQYIIGSWNKIVDIRVEPNIMTTSEGLRNYHPSRRNCFFPGEKRLRYFKVYSQQNCKFECITNFTLSQCGCAAFYMPRTKDTPICGPSTSSRQCITLVQHEYILREMGNEYLDPENKTSSNCNCLPGCSSLTYNSEATFKDLRYSWIPLKREPGLQESVVHISFKDSQFMTQRRSEIFEEADFIASCGGLLGLFLGFSLMSLVEIVYFFTLRLFCNINMHVRRLWNALKVDPLRG